MHAALTVYTVYTRSEIQYNLDSTTDRRAHYSIRRCAPCQNRNGSEHDLHIRAAAGEPAAISRCAMTTVVAPMGYGKTTAVEWYLAERAGAEAPYIVRISVYSSNLAIFWKVCRTPLRVQALLPAGVRLSDRRSQRRTSDRRSVSYADRAGI